MATQPRNVFAIDAASQRSFIIHSVYPGCPNDLGWMMITGPVGDYEKYYGLNSVIYSNLDSRANWNQYGK